MSVQFTGLCGPSYLLENQWAAVERSVNWFPVPIESTEETVSRTILQPSPCNQLFGQLPVPAGYNNRNRGLLEHQGTPYGVNGTKVFSLSPTGIYDQYGDILDDGNPVVMVANGNDQIFIASAAQGWVLATQTGVLTSLATNTDFLGASYATFQDGYILVVTPQSNQFQISGNDTTPIGDATIWSAANVSIQTGQADNLRAIFSSREYLRLLGARRSQIYYNSGNVNFPFISYNETFIETGLASVFSLVDMGDALVWVGEDARGQRACWKDAAFQPQRISNFATEYHWSSYSTVSDAVAFSYIWQGHLMYQITFPTATAPGNPQVGYTWVYDDTVSKLLGKAAWHERQFLNPTNFMTRRPELFHCYAYGRHLVGSDGTDGNPGAIYQYADSPWADCAQVGGSQVQQPLVSDRICPHITNNMKRTIYNRIEFDVARGTASSGIPSPASNPQLLLRWSNDGGNNYGVETALSLGQVGQYDKKIYLNRGGYTKSDRVYWVRISDPVFRSLVNCYLDVVECGS